MENEEDNDPLQDECVDNLSDVPMESDDSEEIEDLTYSDKQSEETESSDDSEIHALKICRTLLPSDTEESDEDHRDIEWSDVDIPRNNNEFEGSPGPNEIPKDIQNVEDVVKLFIDNDLFQFISIETNRYYKQNSNRKKQNNKTGKFVDVTAGELKKWFALVILMGIIKKTKMDDYWSTNPLLETPVFRKTMTRNRFRQILSFLHFSDNNKSDNTDRLYKVQSCIDYFSEKFREAFDPGQNVSIDEGMIPWRGRLNFKVYNPSKMNKYGILVWMLCDSTTGYISCFKICSDVGQSSKNTVMELLTHFYGKWHHLYMDNYYNSVELAEDLFKKKIRVCGTIRQNRGFPSKLKNSKLNVLEIAFQRKDEVLALLWKTSKTKMIRIISTIHNANLVDTQKKCKKTNWKIRKPKCVLDYNKYMKGMDRADRFLSYYPIYRKTIKWSTKVALYLFNCALFNSFRVYQYFNPKSKSLRFHDFLLKICESWLKDNLPFGEENSEVSTTLRASHPDSIDRLSGQIKQHQLIQISATDKRKRRRCHVCYKNKKRKTTNLMCKSCGVALHLGDCFASYHLKKNY